NGCDRPGRNVVAVKYVVVAVLVGHADEAATLATRRHGAGEERGGRAKVVVALVGLGDLPGCDHMKVFRIQLDEADRIWPVDGDGWAHQQVGAECRGQE